MSATTIAEENTAAIAENTAAIADLVYALQVEVARARAAETAAGAYTDTTAATLNAAISALDTTLRAYVDSRSASGMHYRGSVATTSSLPTTGVATGDMYNVAATGRNYVWSGTAWDDCGGAIDTSQLTEWSVFKAHRDDRVAHVTAAERAAWGSSVTFAVGSVTKLAYGSNPTVKNVGSGKDIVLNFGIPAGKPFLYSDFTPAQLAALTGPAGPAPEISVGTVIAGEDSSDAEVRVESQADGYVVLGFTLPTGPKGDPLSFDDLTEEQKAELKGEKGDAVKTINVGSVTTINPDQSATVTKSAETAESVTFDFRIPRGYSPYVYANATALPHGSAPTVNVTSTQTGGSSSVSMTFGIPAGDPGYIALAPANISSGNRYTLTDDTANYISVKNAVEAVTLVIPATYRSSSREVGAHEFTVVFDFDSGWTGSAFNVTWKTQSSIYPIKMHLFSPSTLDFSEAQPGDVIVVHFAEMWEASETVDGSSKTVHHYMVSSKVLSETSLVTAT